MPLLPETILLMESCGIPYRNMKEESYVPQDSEARSKLDQIYGVIKILKVTSPDLTKIFEVIEKIILE